MVKSWETVDLPVAMPPVRPMMSIVRDSVDCRRSVGSVVLEVGLLLLLRRCDEVGGRCRL